MLEARQYYTDFGVLPRAALTEGMNRFLWSFHLINGSWGWQLLLLTVTVAASLAMAAGFRTGVATVVVWALTVSVQARNELVLDGGDVVHRVLLFWAMFLPLGAVWSIDSLRRARVTEARTETTVGTAAFRLQMAVIFVFAALLKTGDPWRKSFDAVWYTLHWDVYLTRFGIWLGQFPDILRWMTRATLVIEGIVPFGLFVPVAPVQVLAMAGVVSLHMGFVLCMHLLMFSGVMVVGWTTFAPGWLWDKLGVPADMPPAWRDRLTRLTENWPLHANGDRQPWFDRHAGQGKALAAILLVYMLAWNVRTLDPKRLTRFFPASMNALGYVLRIDQHWNMFAPSPVNEDGWLVVPAKLASGGMVDLFRDGAPLSWDRPASIADTYKNRRGRKYYWAVTSADAPKTREQFARYLCRAWPEQSVEELVSFEIVLMHEVAKPDLTITAPDKMLLWKQSCK